MGRHWKSSDCMQRRGTGEQKTWNIFINWISAGRRRHPLCHYHLLVPCMSHNVISGALTLRSCSMHSFLFTSFSFTVLAPRAGVRFYLLYFTLYFHIALQMGQAGTFIDKNKDKSVHVDVDVEYETRFTVHRFTSWKSSETHLTSCSKSYCDCLPLCCGINFWKLHRWNSIPWIEPSHCKEQSLRMRMRICTWRAHKSWFGVIQWFTLRVP